MRKKQQPPVIFNIAFGVVLGLLLAVPLAFKNKEEEKKGAKEKEEVIKYYAPQHPAQMIFAGEAVPLDRWDVKERFDRELLFNYYNQANMLFLMKLANRYFPTISERLKAAGVPDDFKYLCVAESNLLAGARSGVGATGFWQFMPKTAPGYGLTANSQVDDRYDLEKSTDAATKYLKQAYAKFGNWTAAAASYNCGMGGYNAQVTYQGTTNYYDLLLPEETNRYIFRILAFKHLMENAEELGFILEDEDKYSEVPHRVEMVSSSIPNLATWARSRGTTYKMVKQMNPWLRGKSLTVSSGKTYQIKLPPAS
ncbi:MAG: lytic transglycosylase domain-containing protein [Chitinophagaceae bacterium]